MSAPAEAYRSTSIFVRDRANSADLKTLIAIFQVDKTTMLNRFYLDGILGLALPDGTEGVVGYCRIGSVNYYMHAAPRLGSVAIADPSNCVAMNDAGLNTLGYTQMNLVKTRASNRIKINTTFKSAYYLNSTDIGFEWRKNGVGSWNVFSLGAGPVAKVIDTSDKAFSTNLVKDDQINVRSYIINDEGNFQGAETSFLVTGPVYPFGANKRESMCDNTSTLYTFYMLDDYYNQLDDAIFPEARATGIFGWKNEDMTIPMDGGYYAGLSGVSGKVFIVGSDGQWIQYGMCDIAPPPKIVGIQMIAIFENGAYRFHVQVNRQDHTYGGSITIGGNIAAFDSNNNQVGAGGNGSGAWQGTLGTGIDSIDIPTSYMPTNNPNVAYYQPTVTINPGGVTYDIYQTGAGE